MINTHKWTTQNKNVFIKVYNHSDYWNKKNCTIDFAKKILIKTKDCNLPTVVTSSKSYASTQTGNCFKPLCKICRQPLSSASSKHFSTLALILEAGNTVDCQTKYCTSSLMASYIISRASAILYLNISFFYFLKWSSHNDNNHSQTTINESATFVTNSVYKYFLWFLKLLSILLLNKKLTNQDMAGLMHTDGFIN